ncbi:MAG: hypothetical protein JWN99_29, partial [Ilumatobacteraceae bacterium]|nr:hypothetical protein [Ilumatobacteraceae bacterium]
MMSEDELEMRPSNPVVHVDDEWANQTRVALGADAPLLDRLLPVLPAGYDELNYPPTAAIDLPRVAALADDSTDGDVATTLMQFAEAPPNEWRFRVYVRGRSIPL